MPDMLCRDFVRAFSRYFVMVVVKSFQSCGWGCILRPTRRVTDSQISETLDYFRKIS